MGDLLARNHDSGALHPVHPLHVVGKAHQVPFAADVIYTPEQELPELHHRLDDPDHRLHRALAQGIQRASFASLEPVRHRRERLRRGWAKGLGSEALHRIDMMALAIAMPADGPSFGIAPAGT